MNFDLRPHYPELPGDGQTQNSEGVQPDEWENCLAPETRVITANGIRDLAGLVGQSGKVLTSGGGWADATFHSFDRQPLLKVAVARGREHQTLYATPDHRWHLQRGGGARVTVPTTGLRPGMFLPTIYGNRTRLMMSPQGIQAGICFGDGAGDGRIQLCGSKTALLSWFPLNTVHERPNGDMTVGHLPYFFKRPPILNEDRGYLLGWLAGYFAADGTVSEAGQAVLSSTNRESLELARDVAAIVGIGAYSVRESARVSNLTGRDGVLYRVTLARETLPDDFLLLNHHRERFSPNARVSPRWTVESVTSDGREEEVFCARVPTTEAFVLDGNLLTSNCTFEALRQTLRAYGYQNLPDDEQMRQMIDPGSHGGEPWTVTQALCAKLAPDLPTSIEQPQDLAAAIREYGGQGFVVHWPAWCDTNAWVPAQGQIVASHAEMALWADDSSIGSRNPWPHPDWSGSDDQIRSLYDGGGILVFHRPLGGAMTASEKDAWVRTWFMAFCGRIPSGQEMAAWAPLIHDNGDNVDDVAAQLQTQQGSTAWITSLQATVQQYESGGGGGGNALVPHTHTTPSGTTGPASKS